MNREEVLTFLKSKKREFHDKFHVSEIGLFGSLARNEQQAGSDIDLIVEFESGTNDIYSMKEGIREIIADRFQTRVDIGRKKSLKSFYRKQIMSDAIFI